MTFFDLVMPVDQLSSFLYDVQSDQKTSSQPRTLVLATPNQREDYSLATNRSNRTKPLVTHCYLQSPNLVRRKNQTLDAV